MYPRCAYSSSKPASGGFTLIEMVIVLGIISVLLGSAIYYMVGSVDSAKIQAVEGNLSTFTSNLRLYEINNRFLPTTEQGLEALVAKPTTEPAPRRWTQYMSEIPMDPWGKPYQYRNPGQHNPRTFDLYSMGPDGIESDDDIGNWK
jgi:general secretion pathway protein G